MSLNPGPNRVKLSSNRPEFCLKKHFSNRPAATQQDQPTTKKQILNPIRPILPFIRLCVNQIERNYGET
jgi:hypothetical protein